MVPRLIFLYEGPPVPHLDVPALAEYVEGLSGTVVAVRPEFVACHAGQRETQEKEAMLRDCARSFARARIRDPDRSWEPGEPLPGEIAYELRVLKGELKASAGMLYDGYAVAEALSHLLPDAEAKRDIFHLVITDRLLGTREPGDKRYHARVVVCSFPCLLSTTGVAEAPARPRGYYLARHALGAAASDPVALQELNRAYAGRFIDYGDERLTEILRGYAAQALAFFLTGQPFCDDPTCRLFNAHWQEEMITAQLGQGPKFCTRHQRLFARHGVLQNDKNDTKVRDCLSHRYNG